ncbi:TRAP transporter small permease [Limibacillus sp. MBR-115]|jgi:TRAP-type C4-dicarboxylate transport system permease small subunit|uniref:TRAP transporter small permease n=1 Tax=Limibacillus sp. MBR-115 TaxID=3156465 RepID=UPI00339B0FA5
MPRLVAISVALSSAALGFLLLVVAASILARILYDSSGGAIDLLIPGAIEAASYALLVLIFAALPLAAGEGLIRVEFLTARLPLALRQFMDRLWLILAGCVGGLMAWNFAWETLTALQRGDATQDMQIPLFLFYGFITITSAAFALAAVLRAVTRHHQAESS